MEVGPELEQAMRDLVAAWDKAERSTLDVQLRRRALERTRTATSRRTTTWLHSARVIRQVARGEAAYSAELAFACLRHGHDPLAPGLGGLLAEPA